MSPGSRRLESVGARSAYGLETAEERTFSYFGFGPMLLKTILTVPESTLFQARLADATLIQLPVRLDSIVAFSLLEPEFFNTIGPINDNGHAWRLSQRGS